MDVISTVDRIIEKHGTGADRTIGILQEIQTTFRYLPLEALERVCDKTEITPSQIYGVATFYAQFRMDPVGEHIIRVCHGTACHVAGAVQVTEAIRRTLSISPDAATDPRRLFTLEAVACLGCCSLAPCMMVDEETHGKLDRGRVVETIDEHRRTIQTGEET